MSRIINFKGDLLNLDLLLLQLTLNKLKQGAGAWKEYYPGKCRIKKVNMNQVAFRSKVFNHSSSVKIEILIYMCSFTRHYETAKASVPKFEWQNW